METQKLELLGEMTKRWKEFINPKLTSIKFCQDSKIVFLEITLTPCYANSVVINLDFISEDEDSDGTFPPYNDIVDNARVLLGLNAFCLNVCFEGLFIKEAEKAFNEFSPKNYSLY